MREFRPGGFQVLPLIVKNILIINALVFLAQTAFEHSSFSIENYFALHDVRSVFFRPHQVISYLFLHGSFGHLFFNMFAVWMFGSALENYFGPKKFLIFYMVCGIGAGLLQMSVLFWELTPIVEIFKSYPLDAQEELLYSRNFKLNVATVGASGSVFGCLAAFGYLFPNSLIYLYFFIPIKAKWFVIMYGAMELYLGLQNAEGDNVAHWAHLGGALVGFLFVYFWKRNNRFRVYR